VLQNLHLSQNFGGIRLSRGRKISLSPKAMRPVLFIIIIIIIIIDVTTYRATAQAVIRRPLTAEVRIRYQLNQCGICDEKIWHETGSSPSTLTF
jgi:hypothetical protein